MMLAGQLRVWCVLRFGGPWPRPCDTSDEDAPRCATLRHSGSHRSATAAGLKRRTPTPVFILPLNQKLPRQLRLAAGSRHEGTAEAERAGGRGDARVGIAADADGHRLSGHLGRLRPRRWYFNYLLVTLSHSRSYRGAVAAADFPQQTAILADR